MSSVKLEDVRHSLFHRPQRCSVEADRSALTSRTCWRSTAHNRSSRRTERHLLYVAHRLPMASASAGVSAERGGVRGFDAHKRVKGRKRHILVDTLGISIACRLEPANVSDRIAGARL